jgi:hypothetical protein
MEKRLVTVTSPTPELVTEVQPSDVALMHAGAPPTTDQ